jgi:hypothetical protein
MEWLGEDITFQASCANQPEGRIKHCMEHMLCIKDSSGHAARQKNMAASNGLSLSVSKLSKP